MIATNSNVISIRDPSAELAIDWRYEYNTQSTRWLRQCERRWNRAEQFIRSGYKIVLLRPLDKATLPLQDSKQVAGLSNPITNVSTLRKLTHDQSEYHHCNYGLIYGMECMTVVDLEGPIGGRNTGAEELITLEVRHSFRVPRNHMVHTPRGGMHLYCGWTDAIKKKMIKAMDMAMDILTGPASEATGHVVGPLSVTADGEYIEDINAPIPSVALLQETTLPPEFIALLNGHQESKHPSKGRRGNRGNENVADEDIFPPMEFKDLEEVLSYIPAFSTSYDDWIKVGMAIHHERPNATGFDIWVEWSSTDQKRFNIKACHTHWESFDIPTRGNPITMGTVINMARDRGYRPRSKYMPLSMMELVQAETPNVYMGGQNRYIKVTDTGEIHEMTRTDVESWYEGQEIIINNKEYNPIFLFMRWPGRIKYTGYELVPPPAVASPATYNVWRGFRLTPVEGDTRKYFELFNQMFPDSTIQTWLHDWLADMIQRPGVKPSTCVVLQGPQGTGKNIFAQIFRSMFLPNNSTQFVNTDQFTSRFNKLLLRNVLAIVNEAVWAGNHKQASILKGYITEDRFEVQDKNVKSFMARNFTRFMIMSNEDWAVPADGSARRFCICYIPLVKPPGDPWWKKMKTELEKDETVAAIMHWYSKREITSNLHEVPVNAAHTRQRFITKTRLSSKDERDLLSTVMWLMRIGKAVHKDGSQAVKPYKGWAVSSGMIRRAFTAATDSVPDGQMIKRFGEMLRGMCPQVTTGVKIMHEGKQQMATILPSMEIMKIALAEFAVMDVDEIDAPDEWQTHELMW